jgi:hypothetical protein
MRRRYSALTESVITSTRHCWRLSLYSIDPDQLPGSWRNFAGHLSEVKDGDGRREACRGPADQEHLGPGVGHDVLSRDETDCSDPLSPPAAEPKDEERQQHRRDGQEGSSDCEWSTLPEQQDRAAGKEADCAAFPGQLGSFGLQPGLALCFTRHVRAPSAAGRGARRAPGSSRPGGRCRVAPEAGLVTGRHLGASRLVLVASAGLPAPPEDRLRR